MTAEAPTLSTLARHDLERLVELALGEARKGGASQAEVGVSVDTGLSVTVRLGEVETLEYQRDRGLGVTVYVDHRKGSASTADLGTAAVLETVHKALSIASFAPHTGRPFVSPTVWLQNEPSVRRCPPSSSPPRPLPASST